MRTVRVSFPQAPLQGVAPYVPGSKSLTNRLFVIGALHPPFQIINPSTAGDSRVFLQFLKQAGYQINGLPSHRNPAAAVEIGSYTRPTHGVLRIQLEHAGTGARFLTALASCLPGSFVFSGSKRLNQRPLKPLLDALLAAGANISYPDEGNFPLRITGNPQWRPPQLELDSAASSQFLSAVLLLAGHLHRGTILHETSAATPSEPYTAMTLGLLRRLGIVWEEQTPNTWHLSSSTPEKRSYRVETDWSNVSYWLALLALTGGDILLQGLEQDSLQGDSQQLQFWQQLGLSFFWHPKGLVAEAPTTTLLPPMNFDFRAMPDLAPTFFALAIFSSGTSVFQGLGTLPRKESNRIADMAELLERFGADVEYGPDWLTLHPPKTPRLPGAPLPTHQDHRIAMSLAPLSVRLPGFELIDPEVAIKSYPGFWREWRKLGGTAEFSG